VINFRQKRKNRTSATRKKSPTRWIEKEGGEVHLAVWRGGEDERSHSMRQGGGGALGPPFAEKGEKMDSIKHARARGEANISSEKEAAEGRSERGGRELVRGGEGTEGK